MDKNRVIFSLTELKEYGKQFLEGGVSSRFRINPFTKLPMYLKKAEGSHIFDITGKKYIDYFMGHGAVLLGHKRHEIEKVILDTVKAGFFAEFDSEINIEFAKNITQIIPCSESVVFTNSGSESTQLAMRLARGFTSKDKIVKIDGHFHGINDYVLLNNIARCRDKNNPGDRISKIKRFSNGIPRAIDNTMIVIPWNNVEIFSDLVKKEGDYIAGIIMNPIDYNNGCITTTKEYLTSINEIAHENNIIVIYDEILSGFRTGISCAQGYYGVTPDICTLGKAISNGVPISVVTGKKKIMSKISVSEEEIPIIHGGTFSGNRLGVIAGIESLKIMKQSNFYNNLLGVANYFFKNLQELFNNCRIPAVVQNLGSNFYIYFGVVEKITDYKQFEKIDYVLANKFFNLCIEKGIYFHTDFTVSAAHTKEDIDITLEKIKSVIKEIK